MSCANTLARKQLQMVDRIAIERFGIPSLVLMENAGRSCAEALLRQGVCTSSPICICCGKGNNGGDGLVMARQLEQQGIPVEVLLFHPLDQFSPDATVNLKILQKSDIPLHELRIPDDLSQLQKHLHRASWVVDALLGTGSAGPIRGIYEYIIPVINQCGRPVLAVDLPSGLDCDLGTETDCIIQATMTVTLVAPKPGFLTPTGRKHCGEITTGQIGLPRNLLLQVRRKN